MEIRILAMTICELLKEIENISTLQCLIARVVFCEGFLQQVWPNLDWLLLLRIHITLDENWTICNFIIFFLLKDRDIIINYGIFPDV